MKTFIKAVVIVALATALFKIAPYILPAEPILKNVDFSTSIYDRSGKLMRLTLAKDSSYRAYVSINNISSKFKEATLLYEDRWFYYHFGVNPISIVRGGISYFSGDKRPFGGSTITMQLARIKYNINSKTIIGKFDQILKAVYLEVRYTKDEILEAYLNIAPYGHNISGIEAASLIYFNVRSSSLSLLESLSLAVIPQNPTGRTPTKSIGLNNLIEARMRLFNMWLDRYPKDIPYQSLFSLPITVKAPIDLPYSAPHFTDRLILSGEKGDIYTTLNIEYQKLIEKRIDTFIRRNSSIGINNSAALLINYKTMETIAYIGSADYFNEGISGQVDGVSSMRSPGSTLKPFIYALAIEQGLIHSKSMLKDAPRRFGSYSPENSDRGFMGPIFASDALVHSRNIPAITLLNMLEKPTFYDLLKQVDINGLQDEEYYGSALALGGFEVSMFNIAEFYLSLANLGVLKNIKLLKNTYSNNKAKILTKESSFLTLEMMATNPKPFGFENIGAVYWKTGTSFAYRDAWSGGIFGDYVLVVWVGNFNGEGNPVFTGRGVAAPLFFSIIRDIKNIEKINLEKIIPPTSLNITLVDICSPTGDLPNKYCPETELGWFIPGVSPITVSDVYRQIPVDKKTGLRACSYDKETSYLEVYEFWDTDMYDLFRKSGIHKKIPPKYMGGCNLDDTSYLGSMPTITMPANNWTYTIPAKEIEEKLIPFTVSVDSSASKIYWFINGKFIGNSLPSEIFFWEATTGTFKLMAIDDIGRSSSIQFNVNIH